MSAVNETTPVQQHKPDLFFPGGLKCACCMFIVCCPCICFTAVREMIKDACSCCSDSVTDDGFEQRQHTVIDNN